MTDWTRGWAKALILASVAVSATAAQDVRADDRDDSATAETLGAADAVTASVWGPAALVFNPAGLLKVPILLVQTNYNYLEGQNGHTFQAGVVDARTSEHAALGLSYNYVTAERGGYERFGHQVRLGLGTGYRSGEFGLFAGVGARYTDMRFRPLNDTIAPYAEGDLDAWTLDVGLMLDFADRIRFGVVGQNLLDVGHSEALRTLGLGLSFVFSTLEVGATMKLDLSGFTGRTITAYAFGADYGIGDAFRIRLGLDIDVALETERVTAGFGWSNQSFAVDLGWATSTAEPTDMIFGLSVRLLPGL